MGTLAHIFRHPIKGVGAEALSETRMDPGQAMPWDRAWAIAHEAARLQDGWTPCANFIRGAKSASLMAVTASTDTDTGRITLSHPDRPTITIDPETDGPALVDWVRPITNPGRAAPTRLVHAGSRGMTDSDFPSVSILGLASLRALSDKAGRDLDPRRFRGNFWIDGLGPWEEFEWIGRTLRIGTAEVEIRERITRCTATTVDPETGRPDTDTLGLLDDGWGHQDLGVYGVVTSGGTARAGDPVALV